MSKSARNSDIFQFDSGSNMTREIDGYHHVPDILERCADCGVRLFRSNMRRHWKDCPVRIERRDARRASPRAAR